MARRNRKSTRRNRRNNRRQNGGACALAGAPYGADLMADSRAQSLAQGNQFATITRPYHGGARTRRRNRRVMYGGMAPLSIFGSEGTGVDRASAHLTGQDNALAEAAGYSRTHPDLPDAMGAQVLDAVNKGMAQVGGRRRRSRKGNRKSRKNRKNRNSRRNRRMNGGRRSSCGMMRGGAALLEGAPYSQGSSDMLLADDAALQAQAAKMESPAWTGVARGTYLG
jgi:hypothetical protein